MKPLPKVSPKKFPASHTAPKPAGVPIPTKPGASTRAICKTCGQKPAIASEPVP